jgi:hypothetical protein
MATQKEAFAAVAATTTTFTILLRRQHHHQLELQQQQQQPHTQKHGEKLSPFFATPANFPLYGKNHLRVKT